MKRTATTIKQFDYTSKEEFEKDKTRMKEKGYSFVENNGWAEFLKSGEVNDDKWKFTAYFVKSGLD